MLINFDTNSVIKEDSNLSGEEERINDTKQSFLEEVAHVVSVTEGTGDRKNVNVHFKVETTEEEQREEEEEEGDKVRPVFVTEKEEQEME